MSQQLPPEDEFIRLMKEMLGGNKPEPQKEEA